jgi:hypothetical protein
MTRQSKSPRQRAEEALAIAERAVKRLAAKKTALAADLDAITKEHDQAVVRRDYLAAHPDLGDQAAPLRVRTGVDQLKPATSTGDPA